MVRPNIFGANIAKRLNSALGSRTFKLTLRVETIVTDPADVTETIVQDTVEHPCNGFIDNYRSSDIDGTRILAGDRKITLFGASLPTDVDPQPGNYILAEGQAWKIVGDVVRDPAGATYECQSRL